MIPDALFPALDGVLRVVRMNELGDVPPQKLLDGLTRELGEARVDIVGRTVGQRGKHQMRDRVGDDFEGRL